MVYIHGKALLSDATRVEIINADIRDPAEILTDPAVPSLIDFDKPVGLLMLAILHHIADRDDPASIAARFRNAMPAGSYLAISSFRLPGTDTPRAASLDGGKRKDRRPWVRQRALAGGRGDPRLVRDWELLPPGLVPLVDWRPDEQHPYRAGRDLPRYFGGVARKN